MAGSWEPLPFRVRRDGAKDYTPTAEQVAAYRREQSPEMVEQLKALGVNFVMMPRLQRRRPEGRARKHAGCRTFSPSSATTPACALGSTTTAVHLSGKHSSRKCPRLASGCLLDTAGKPLPYSSHYWRYFWNRNHPDAQAFYRGLVKFAVQDIQTDLVHFDNHDVGPSNDPVSAERFRQYLAAKFTPEQREAMGITDLKAVQPPVKGPANDVVRRAWIDFSAQSPDRRLYRHDPVRSHAAQGHPHGVQPRRSGARPFVHPSIMVGFCRAARPSGMRGENPATSKASCTHESGRTSLPG